MSKLDLKIDITEKDSGWNKILRTMSQPPLNADFGLFEDSGSTDGATHATKAFYNEFGTVNPYSKAEHCPSRPFMRDNFDENVEKYIKWVREAGTVVIVGKASLRDALSIIGFKAVGDLRDKVQEPMEPGNAASTIRKKGFGFPLIETGAMYNALSFKVRP